MSGVLQWVRTFVWAATWYPDTRKVEISSTDRPRERDGGEPRTARAAAREGRAEAQAAGETEVVGLTSEVAICRDS